jgi:hypothetical protein
MDRQTKQAILILIAFAAVLVYFGRGPSPAMERRCFDLARRAHPEGYYAPGGWLQGRAQDAFDLCMKGK